MRTLAIFMTGLLVGVGVQAGLAQEDKILAVNHVGIAVTDFDQAMKFYTQSLGFREAFTVRDENRQPILAYVQVSRDTFVELQPATPDRRPGITHFGVEVKDIRATIARLKQRGVAVEDPRAGRTDSLIANVTDRDGIRMELSELGPQSLQRKAIASWK